MNVIIHRTAFGRFYVVDTETGEILSEYNTKEDARKAMKDAQTPDTG